MKKSIFIFVFLVTAFSAFSQGKVRWLEQEHDFGTFAEDLGNVSCVMKFVNDGDKPIMISRVRPTCGCTASEFSKEAVAPGDTAEVTLTYNPTGRPGKFKKDAYVYTNGIPEKSYITIRGNVIGSASTMQAKYPVTVGSLRLDSQIVPFGELMKGSSRTAFINGYNRSTDSLRVYFENVPKNLRIASVPEKVAPGELVSVTITYYTSKKEDWGLCQDKFTLLTEPLHPEKGNAAGGMATIDVTAIVNEAFSNMTAEEQEKAPVAVLSTEKLDFGTLLDKPMTQTFEITNKGENPLQIRKIGTFDTGVALECKTKEVKKGKSCKVKVTIAPNQIEGKFLNAKIVILTNDPINSRLNVRVVGLKETK